ncbi:unnamed protein product [Brassica napus]|uniref:(rape) hypothetical protein n=1 Tax=Brassica napus TaxID=3708 RepID=A0A816KRS1_BRANA|nr:unnamed protein product [Brassica napus]
MGYAALETLGALWSIIRKDGAAVNKSLDVRVRKTENESALRCKKFQLTRPRRLLTVKLCFNEPVKAKNRELCRNWGYSRKNSINREQGPKRLFHCRTLRVITMALLSDDSAACEVVTMATEYIVWEVYTEVKALQLQTITGLVFQEYVAGIKNKNVVQETPWQGRDAFRVQLDLSRELYKSVVTNLERRRLQFVHGAAIFQVKHKFRIGVERSWC